MTGSVRAVMMLLTVLSCAAMAHGQGLVKEMTPDLIAEAIKAGERGNISDGQLTKSSGWSWGSIEVASFSTPFMRVALAARRAKKEYRTFSPADVTPEMVAPELHVYAWAQTDGPRVANVSAVVITARSGKSEEKIAKAIHPTRFEPIPMQFQNLFGANLKGVGIMAVFPLSALSENYEVHVVYDKAAMIGWNAAGGTHCEDCSAPFKLKNVR